VCVLYLEVKIVKVLVRYIIKLLHVIEQNLSIYTGWSLRGPAINSATQCWSFGLSLISVQCSTLFLSSPSTKTWQLACIYQSCFTVCMSGIKCTVVTTVRAWSQLLPINFENHALSDSFLEIKLFTVHPICQLEAKN